MPVVVLLPSPALFPPRLRNHVIRYMYGFMVFDCKNNSLQNLPISPSLLCISCLSLLFAGEKAINTVIYTGEALDGRVAE